jgi:deoxyribonuclease-4
MKFGAHMSTAGGVWKALERAEQVGADCCQVFVKVSTMVGLEQVLAFHLNDSKTELGSRVDRHAHIGQGKIGKEGFRHIVNDSRFRHLPGCLETPKGKDLREDIENLAVLRGLVGKP